MTLSFVVGSKLIALTVIDVVDYGLHPLTELNDPYKK